MAIGQHECRTAGNTHPKEAIAIGLDEGLTAREESFCGLSDEQVRALPVPGGNDIARAAMHSLDSLGGGSP